MSTSRHWPQDSAHRLVHAPEIGGVGRGDEPLPRARLAHKLEARREDVEIGAKDCCLATYRDKDSIIYAQSLEAPEDCPVSRPRNDMSHHFP